MVDIQSVAVEIRRGKKKDRREKETTGQKYNGPLLHRAAVINTAYQTYNTVTPEFVSERKRQSNFRFLGFARCLAWRLNHFHYFHLC